MKTCWLAINPDGTEIIFQEKPVFECNEWSQDLLNNENFNYVEVPKGTIEKILGYKLSHIDSPIEI